MDDDVPCMTSEEARETFDLGASSPVIAARASWTPQWTPQTREWDCARACASCVLGRRARDAARRRRSTWTIDLAGIFTAAGARGVMLVTKTIGVDPRLAEDAFYEEDYLRDVARVNAAFRRATALDSPVRVVRRRVRAGDIAAIVLNGARAWRSWIDADCRPRRRRAKDSRDTTSSSKTRTSTRRRLRSSIPRATLERRGAKS